MTKRMIIFLLCSALLALSLPALAETAGMDAPFFGEFAAENLRGDEPITEAIFGEADLTLVNYWATWCPPCVSELPDLAKISELTEGRVQVLGVLLDGLDAKGERDEDAIEAMNLLLDNAEAEYPSVLPDEWLMRVSSLVTSIPTTFLVDKEGIVVGIIIGARNAQAWLTEIGKVLAPTEATAE